MNGETLLIPLLRAEICGGTVSDKLMTAIYPELLAETYELAQKHDLAHIAGQALSKQHVLRDDEVSIKFKTRTMQAVYRYVRMSHEYQNICETLEEAHIPFIPLKGAVLRDYYPEPWMRTSCDIDILVREDDLEKAAKSLVEKLSYTRKEKTDHDISMFSATGMHLELHYAAVDMERLPKAQVVLKNIWSHVTTKPDEMYHYYMTDEMFYFYHITHMAKHFENGGCGIRPFLDLWILNHCVEYDRDKRDNLLVQGGMLTYGRAAQNLSEAWFSGAELDPLSSKMAKFILSGGVYGTLHNLTAVRQAKRGSKIRYALSRIFLPYDTIKYHYPILHKNKWMTPFFEVARWLKLIFQGGAKRSLKELKVIARVSTKKFSYMSDLLQELGL